MIEETGVRVFLREGLPLGREVAELDSFVYKGVVL